MHALPRFVASHQSVRARFGRQHVPRCVVQRRAQQQTWSACAVDRLRVTMWDHLRVSSGFPGGLTKSWRGWHRYELAVVKPDWLLVAKGLIPDPVIIRDPGMLYVAIGIVGARPRACVDPSPGSRSSPPAALRALAPPPPRTSAAAHGASRTCMLAPGTSGAPAASHARQPVAGEQRLRVALHAPSRRSPAFACGGQGH